MTLTDSKQFRVALVALLGLAMLSGGGFQFIQSGETVYEYQVKSEQVSDANSLDSNELVELKELSPRHQEAIFTAFKKSDHFFGGSSASINTDECLNLTQEEKWQVVEVEGVPLLVGVAGPDTYESATWQGMLGMILTVVGIITMFIALAMWGN